MDKNSPAKKDDTVPFRMITTTWEDWIGDCYFYDVVYYRHPKGPIVIHRRGCFMPLKEELEHFGEEPSYVSSYSLVVDNPPSKALKQAEKWAEQAAREKGRPGWRKAPCCSGPPCVPYDTVKDMKPQWRRKEPHFMINMKTGKAIKMRDWAK